MKFASTLPDPARLIFAAHHAADRAPDSAPWFAYRNPAADRQVRAARFPSPSSCTKPHELARAAHPESSNRWSPAQELPLHSQICLRQRSPGCWGRDFCAIDVQCVIVKSGNKRGVVTVQNPSCCFSMSTFGPLQKFTSLCVASGALTRICTLPALSTRGYSASQTLVAAGRKSTDSCAQQKMENNEIRKMNCQAVVSSDSPCKRLPSSKRATASYVASVEPVIARPKRPSRISAPVSGSACRRPVPSPKSASARPYRVRRRC